MVEYFTAGRAQQNHYINVYIHGVEDGKYLAESYRSAFGRVKVGKSDISFKKLEDTDLDALLDIVAQPRERMKKALDFSPELITTNHLQYCIPQSRRDFASISDVLQ